MTIEELRRGNLSKQHNPLAAELLRRIHTMEAWGRGIPFIFEKEPGVEFKEAAKLCTTSFKRRSFMKALGKRISDTKEKGKSPEKTPKK